MSTNQNHGKEFENIVKLAFGLDNEDNIAYTAEWDIPSIFDKDNIPTSIKTSKNLTICMADARSFLSINDEFRLVIGIYTQQGTKKQFVKIIEYSIIDETFSIIKGNLTYGDVVNFHNAIQLDNISDYIEARKLAKKIKISLANRITLIRLNPKIDHLKQRRLQCSLRLNDLDSIKDIKKSLYIKEYRGIIIPFDIESSKREFLKRK